MEYNILRKPDLNKQLHHYITHEYGSTVARSPPVETDPEDIKAFDNKFQWTRGHIFTCLFFHIIPIFLVRLVVVIVFVLLGLWLIPLLMTIGHTYEVEGKLQYYSARRAWWIRKTIQYSSRIILLAMGYIMQVEGELDPRARVLVSTHCTPWDTLFIFASGVPCTPYTLDTMMKKPLLGWILKILMAVEVQRTNGPNSKEVLGSIKDRAADERFPPVLLFPEGTNTSGESVISFKTGSFRSGYAVQPVVLDYTRKNSAWVINGPSSATILWMIVWQFDIGTRVVFLPLIEPPGPTDQSHELAVEHGQLCREAMAKALRVPMTDHTVEDSIFLGLTVKLFGEKIETPFWKRLKASSAKPLLLRNVKHQILTFFKGTRTECTKNADDEWKILDYLELPSVSESQSISRSDDDIYSAHYAPAEQESLFV